MTEQILQMQREFFASGKTADISFRKRSLMRLHEEISSMADEILDALHEDLGKSRHEGYMCEVGLALSEIRSTVRHLRNWSRPRKARTPLSLFPGKSRIYPSPYGNVLIMSPWNYPFLLCISPLISAVAAGNTAVVKPSAYSPATSAVVEKLIGKVFRPEHVAVAKGGRDVNTDLLERKFDYIFFTGSKAVGRIVMEKAAAHLTPVTLELGGKSPAIVHCDADLQTGARRIVFGKFLNCGQTCVAPDLIFVHEDVADRFIGLCKDEIVRMYGAEPLGNGSYGKIVNRKHFDRLSAALEECRADVVYGGRTDAETLKIEPTLIRLSEERGDELALMRDEIFGPLMPILTYRDIDEVVRYIESHPRPLAAYFFTRNGKLADRLVRGLRFGGGCVNDTIIHLATENMPFGGVGESGMGHYHGKYGFDTFSHLKSIVRKGAWPDPDMRYQPYTALKSRLVKMFLK